MAIATAQPDLTAAAHRRLTGLLVCIALLVLACVLSLAVGTQTVGLATVWQAVTDYSDTGNEWIVHELRIPRTVLGVVVGIALGLSGALIQGITRNPLADSQILGIESVAGLFVVSAIALLGLHSLSSYIWFGFLGAFVAMLAVYAVAASGRMTATPVRMLLAGVAVGAVADGVSFSIRLHYPRAFDSMRFWDAGALDGRPMEVAVTVAPFVVLGAALCLYVSRGLNAVALGDDLAVAMGGNVVRTRVLGLVGVTLLAGAATAAAGPIGFVGLMVPHAVRWFTGPDWRWICAYCVFAAPALLLAADVVGRVVVPPGELPAGIVTAFIGAPVLIWLVRRTTASGL
ncbi:ABC-type transporter, permease components [Mycolicibacterium canariasense]|uniref:ABC-type transporter, permease components n=1 Tax=Mycolicibacterium canariasense TaxID=228230 RepID=A0A100WBI5_MYCCR|nr:iron chelate uptake ABC transporter family permease subunit [Mycolicibacterium canariasense]MCV7209483.1 iron chelate uptake ABC transporter family permease subunit [Mycolicibacterium canariasense]ORV05720.1 ABC transporter permease [Mycolicibacterium canariasense]GAS94981.1 ABC-type transporter, permease components [Mycolicibacterium canariasense]